MGQERTVPSGSPARVLYSFPHQLGMPGIGTTALHQVRGLIDRGLDVTVCCTSMAPAAKGLNAEVVETLVVGGHRIPHRALGSVDRAMRYHDRRAARVLSRRRSAVDVVHGWPLGSSITFAAARDLGIVRLRESPNCYTAVAYERVAHEVARLGMTVPRGASHRFDASRLEREETEYDRASAVLAPSEAVEESYRHRAGSPIRVLRHRYGFDPGGFPEPVAERDSNRPFVMAFVGSCEPRKGVHHALAAWRRAGAASRNGRFLIVGRWEDAYRRLLSADLTAPGVQVRDFTGDVGSVLRSADVLVLPSVEEGSALVTYEAQASGCALLVSDAAGALMTDGVHGLVHRAGDVAELAAHVGRLSEDRALLARMRRAVLAHRAELTWAAAAERLEQLYCSELGRS